MYTHKLYPIVSLELVAHEEWQAKHICYIVLVKQHPTFCVSILRGYAFYYLKDHWPGALNTF